MAEVCDGTAVACPTDAKRPSAYECRVSAGLCDVTEVCDGTAVACLSDAKRPNGYECRASAGVLPGPGCDRGSAGRASRVAVTVAAAKTFWGETPVARVGDGVVTREAVARRLAAQRREVERLGRRAPEPAEVLAELAQQELLVPQAVRQGVLASDADLRERIIERLFAKRQREQRLPTPSSDELRGFFAEHRRLFPEDERVKLRHILLPVPAGATPAAEQAVRRRAEDLRRRAAARPAAFGELARAHSADPSAKLGGDTGYLPAGRWAVVFGDEIQPVLPGLQAGQSSAARPAP